jgi:hypothetical protein
LAPANHAGARPRPLHVAPDFGWRYIAGCGPRTEKSAATKPDRTPHSLRRLALSFDESI